jgi:hypothetical protein
MIQITGFYTMIRLGSNTPLMIKAFSIGCPLVIISCTKVCLDFAMKYTNASSVFPDSFHEWSKHSLRHNSDEDMERYREKCRIFRTYRPFHFRIGSFFNIHATTFNVATSDVVLEGVVALLLL